MSLTRDPSLAAMIASRICHDLISPLGAIGNGVELLTLTDGGGPELSLIGESAANASARLRCFRIAFGAASGDQAVSRAEILAVLAGLTAAGRVRYHWNLAGDCRRPEAKAAFLALLCLDTALAYGGEIAVTRDGDRWTVAGTATKYLHDPRLWQHVGGTADPDAPPLASAHVQFLLLPAELARQGRQATVMAEDGRLSISF